jgi:hypothetical protein
MRKTPNFGSFADANGEPLQSLQAVKCAHEARVDILIKKIF